MLNILKIAQKHIKECYFVDCTKWSDEKQVYFINYSITGWPLNYLNYLPLYKIQYNGTLEEKGDETKESKKEEMKEEKY